MMADRQQATLVEIKKQTSPFYADAYSKVGSREPYIVDISPYYRASAPERGFTSPPKSPSKTKKQIQEE